MRILYLTQFFEPEPMIKGAGFVRALVERGHEVEVVTGFPNYPVGKLYNGYRLALHREETIDGVTVHRVPLYPSHGRSSIGRMLNYFSFVLSATFYGLFKAGPFDAIYSYPPPTVAIAADLIGRIRRRPFILDVQDLWPDSVVTSGMTGTGKMGALLRYMMQYLYRRAARIVAQSRGIAAKLVERGVDAEKIDVIFNWADEDAARPLGTCDLAPYGLSKGFNFVYGGNLGSVQGLSALVHAACLAAESVPELQLLLIGNGMDRDRLERLRDEIGATNVIIAASVPRTQIGDVFAAADVLVMHLKGDPLFEITIPQKTQFYLAMGKPVLIGVRGEAAEFVTRAGAGIAVEPDNVEEIAAGMVRLASLPGYELRAMGIRASEAYRDNFSFQSAVDQTLQSVQRAIAGGSGSNRAVEATASRKA